MKKICTILLLLVSCSFACNAQTFPFRTYSIEKGLSEAVVNDLIQVRDGYIWIATGYGLNRFDGTKFKNYYEENGLGSNKIYSLFEDNSHTIWVGTGAGVNSIKSDSIQTHAALAPLESSTILEVFQDDNNEFWFATDGQGVWHLDKNQNLTQYSTVNGLANDRIRDIVQDAEGTLWFGTRGGLTSLKDGNFRSYTTADGLPDNKIRDLQVDKEGMMLWIATREGLSRFKENQFVNFAEQDGLINNRIQSISPDDKGNLWLGTEDGASFFENGRFTNYSVDEGLTNNTIYATLYDQENNIWFGTLGGGISVFLGKQFKNYTIEDGLPNPVITSITQDNKGNHWIATLGGGIARLNNGDFKIYNEETGLVNNKAYNVVYDSKNRLLVGTRWGLSILENETFYNYDETELPYRKIRAIHERSNKDEYWFGTLGEGVLRLKDNTFTSFSVEDGLAHNRVLAVEESTDGAMWFATYGGVSRYKDGSFTNYTIKDGLPNNGVLDIVKAKDGALWFSTFGGIARFEDGTFTPVTAQDGLPDEVCYFIIQGDDKKFWIGTNKGVIRFDYDIYKQAENQQERNNAFKLITQNQGLIANEMNAGAGYKDKEGNLWFGSVSGLTQFDPDLQKNSNVPPTIHIEDVRISDELVKNRRDLEVPSDARNILIEFVGINFSAPEQITYRYRLKNSGEDWRDTNQREVRYSALLPGDYQFQVKAKNSEGIWSRETARLSFTVLAPFWMQWWFIVLILLALAGIVFFIYNYYRVRKMVDIERMRVRIASDLHDDVGSSLTEIALQSDFLQTTDASDELKESVQHIGAQSRRIVSSLDDIVWSIDARNDTLGDLTDRMQDYINNILSDRQVVYHFDDLDMDKKLTVPMKENLYLIFKEAINNIAKHSNATKVEVQLRTDADFFYLIIHDNGTKISQKRKTGHGLRNMDMRAQRIDASVTFKNEDGFTVHVKGDR
jgi:ligand-binding sensor domain-containing protein